MGEQNGTETDRELFESSGMSISMERRRGELFSSMVKKKHLNLRDVVCHGDYIIINGSGKHEEKETVNVKFRLRCGM